MATTARVGRQRESGGPWLRHMLALTAAVALATSLHLGAAAMPVLGGKLICSLQATVGGGSATEVDVGEEVLIEGFGFPALIDVEISYSIEGTPIGTVTETADATGSFEVTVTPAAGQEGLWTVTATDVGDLCTAETGFLVVSGPACSLELTGGFGDETGAMLGDDVLIEGFGFPPGDVEITYSVDGSVIGAETVTADGTGSFQTVLINPSVEGTWTITASDLQGVCEAEAGFGIAFGGGATPSPVVSQLPNAAADPPTGVPSGRILPGVLLGLLTLAMAGWTIAHLVLTRRLR